MTDHLETAYDNLTAQTVEEFLSELKSSAREDEYGTVAFLRDRIDDFSRDIQDRYNGVLTEEDKGVLRLRVQVVASYLLLLGKTEGYEFQQKFLLLLEALSHLSPRSANALAQKAVDCLVGKISAIGFTWMDITSNLSADILAYKITIAPSLGKCASSDTFEKKGCFSVRDGEIRVSAYSEKQASTLVKTFGICSDMLGLYVKDTRDERLKASETQNIKSIETFFTGFTENQKVCRPSQKAVLKKYQEGDRMAVQITGMSEDGNILVKTVDPAYKTLTGQIIDEQLVVGLNVSDLIEYLMEDSCFTGVCLDEIDGDQGVFSIYNSYVDYADKQANFARRNGNILLAKAFNIYGTDRINWISANGIGMISFYDPSVKVGDVRAMMVLNTKENSNGYYVNARIVGGEDTLPGHTFNPDTVLKYFTKDLKYISKDFVQPVIFAGATGLKDSAIRSLATVLLNARHDGNSLAYYRSICTARVLYTLVGDADKASCAEAKAMYMKNCVLFARGEAMTFPERDLKYNSEDQTKILSTLMCLGRHENEGALCGLLSIVPQNSPIAKIARLILGKNTALLADNDMGFSDAALRREVAAILGVSDMVLDEDCADIPTGKYGNVERQFREFKSSYVYRNDDSGADFQKQGRDEVFQAVCGLLNTDGGQVYVGVNNNGDPIVDSSWGIAADIKWLKSNYVKVNGLRKEVLGHNTCKVTDIDSFVNFLQDEKHIYFKDSVIDNIIIEPTEDMDAICISVSPSEYEIAYLYEDGTHTVGQAFRRDGNRTIPMTEVEKQKRLMKLQSIGKEVEFQIQIQEAIDQGKKIILKNYASSEIRDRFLVPICLLYGGESVWCIDLGESGRPCKQFRLSRAQGVEVVDEKYPHGIAPIGSDIFRFTGEKKYHVRLRMQIGARNLLVEEYPEVSKLPENEFYKEGEEKDARWILDTHIANIVGVRRFYIGLADKVEILDTEDSEDIRKNILEFCKDTVERDLEK